MQYVLLLPVLYLAAALETSLGDVVRVGRATPDLLALVAVVLTAGLAAADVFTFTATLSGGNEVPANASPAIGMATLIWDEEGTLDFPLHI